MMLVCVLMFRSRGTVECKSAFLWLLTIQADDFSHGGDSGRCVFLNLLVFVDVVRISMVDRGGEERAVGS